jgi:hypothetical protein
LIIKNKLDKVFGPFGSSTGFFMFFGGIIATYFSPIGLVIVLIGGFVSFTTTSTFIDTQNKRVKYSNNFFGFIPVGKWINIYPEMKLGLKKSHHGYRAYIRGTQPVDIHNNDIRIFLYSSDNKQLIPLKKFSSYKTSAAGIKELGSILELNILD